MMQTTSLKNISNSLLIIVITVFFTGCNSNRITVFDTQCGNLDSPVGISEDWIKFSWKLSGEKQNLMQSAYQILVSDDLKTIKNDEGNIWNSGKVESEASIQIDYSGKPLGSAKKYYWKVKVWDEEGLESEWSETDDFVTAFFNQNDWDDAKWIVYEEMQDSLRLEMNLAQEIRQNNYALTSGDVGYRYLLQALHEAGYSDIIYRMNSRSDVPGYGYQLKKGATSLTESWKAEGASHNHMMLGHLMEWFFSAPGGIKQAEGSVAFKNIVIEPEIVGDLSYCQTSYESPYGKISCDWKLKEDKDSLEMHIEIPANTKATVYIPFLDENTVFLNERKLEHDDFEVIEHLGKIKARIKLGSGLYHISVTG